MKKRLLEWPSSVHQSVCPSVYVQADAGILWGYAICTAEFSEIRARVDWYYGVKKVLVGLTPKNYYDNGSIVTSERPFYKYMNVRP